MRQDDQSIREIKRRWEREAKEMTDDELVHRIYSRRANQYDRAEAKKRNLV
jgi:uncharacterized protein